MHTVHQHWDPLKVCIIGRSYPPEFYSGIENSKVRGSLEKIAIETEEDYQKLKSKLEEFGVTVLRTDVSENPEDHAIGIKGKKPCAPPMCPRDFTTMIGNRFFMPSPKYGDNIDVEKIFNGLLDKNLFQRDNSREKILAKYLTDLMLPGRPISSTAALIKLRNKKGLWKEWWDADTNSLSSLHSKQTPKGFTRYLAGIDAEEVKKLIFAAETNTIGSIDKFPNNKDFYSFTSVEKWCKENDVPIVYDTYINGASSWRIGKDLYFNYVNIVNKLNENVYMNKWKKLFPDYRVTAVDMPGHGDGGMHPVVPGLIITIKDAANYSKSFPDWEVVTLPGESWYKVEGFIKMKKKNRGRWWVKGEEDNQELIDYIDNWLDHWVTYAEETVFDVNMLVVDKKNVIVNGYNKTVFDAFDRYGITPHVVNFRHRYFWDGGLHCITSDISREGEQQDYHL